MALADFSRASALGFEQGQQMAEGQNSLGQFIRNMLATYQEKRKTDYEMQKTMGMNVFKQNLENESPLNKAQTDYYKARTNVANNPNEQPIFTIDENGGLVQAGSVPKGSRVLPPNQMMNPTEQGQVAAERAVATERAKASANIPSAIRDIVVLNKQFNEAFPPKPGTENNPAYQRAIGFAKGIGAKTGIGVTPKQTAALKVLPLASIGLIRLAGALGRVTNIELQMAEETMNQQGLTPDERFQLARTLATQYMSRISPDEWKLLKKSNPDLPNLLKEYDIHPTQLEDNKLTNLKSKYGLQ